MIPNLVWQFSGLLILAGGTAWGYKRWLKPQWASLTWQGRGLIGLIILTLMGGFIGSPFWWLDLTLSFAWDLPPLASRMLAAAGWAFAFLCFLILEKLSARRAQLALLTLETYLAPLVIAILLFHLNRFDFTLPITYAFLLIAGGMMIIGVYFSRHPVTLTPADLGLPAQPLLRYWFSFLAGVLTLWGVALFVTDRGPLDFIWVWPGDLLTSRLIATMLFTLVVGSIQAVRHTDNLRPILGMSLIYGYGVAAANLWNVLSAKPIQFSYLLVFGVIGIVSTILFIREKN